MQYKLSLKHNVIHGIICYLLSFELMMGLIRMV